MVQPSLAHRPISAAAACLPGNVLEGFRVGHAATSGPQIDGRELVRILRLEDRGLEELGDMEFTTRRLKQGDHLYRAGDRFDALFVVRSGFLKSVVLDADAVEQVVGFPMAGDTLGIDAIDSGAHRSDAIALDATEVVIIPFSRFVRLARQFPALELIIYRSASRQLVREQSHLWMLGVLSAEARVAAFLLDLSERFGAMRYSRTAFVLRMSRQEIGSYLGLTIETVSRALSAFVGRGLVEVKLKDIRLVDLEGLGALTHCPRHAAGGERAAGIASRPARRHRPAHGVEAALSA